MTTRELLTPSDNRTRRFLREVQVARREIRQGRFQRSMAVIATFAAIASAFEAYMQHQRGAFSNRWMWTPIWLAPPVVGSAGAALYSRRAARTLLPAASWASLLDGVIGFGLHLRGISRMAGGYKLGQYNIVMGPPIFAPLLVGMAGVLGLLASALRPEDLEELGLQIPGPPDAAPRRHEPEVQISSSSPADGALKKPLEALTIPPAHNATPASEMRALESAIRYGRFQKVMAATTAVFAALTGGEAYFEHLRGSYNARIMWTPVWVTPPMMAAAVGSVRSERVARHVLPWASALTFADGVAGFLFHIRGLKRMPGSLENARFNLTYGPPLFAPLLFCAVGLLGFIASLLRRRGD